MNPTQQGTQQAIGQALVSASMSRDTYSNIHHLIGRGAFLFGTQA